MVNIRVITSCILFLSTALLGQSAAPQGALCIIGGAQKSDNAALYREIIRLAGGPEKVNMAIIAAGSIQPTQTAQDIMADFRLYGVKTEQMHLLPIAVVDDPGSRELDESTWIGNGFSAELAAGLAESNLIYFSGGDQIRYRQTLLDEKGQDGPVLKAVRQRYRQGAVVAGTSAGAAMMSDPMIVSGSSLDSLTGGPTDPVRWDHGLGFWPGVMVDQHFLKRGRVGRLVAMLLHPDIRPLMNRGFGIDEDTALLVQHGQARVVGRSGVLVVDTQNASVQGSGAAMKISGVRIHYLHDGDSLTLDSGEFHIASSRQIIAAGKEYYESCPSSPDIFGRDTLLTLLTQGLADCRQTEIFGLAFDPAATGQTPGVRLRLYKTDQTRSYLGEIDGEETFSILHIGLDVLPVKVRIESGS